MSCPYKNQSFMSKMVDKEITLDKTSDPEKAIPKTCPYSKDYSGPNPHTKTNIPNTTSNETTPENKKDDEESEDEQPTGGCPVMNKGIFISLILNS
jgi:hypothetical protein